MSVLKKFFERLFYTPKRAKLTNENITHMLLPSLIGVAVCAVCLVGLTFAWFTASVETGPQTLTASSFHLLDVKVSQQVSTLAAASAEGSSEPGVTKDEGGLLWTISFPSAGEYAIKLTAEGGGSGYCKINDDVKTGSFKDAFAFTVTVSEAGDCTITPVWGTCVDADVKEGANIRLAVTASDEGGNSSETEPDPTEEPTELPTQEQTDPTEDIETAPTESTESTEETQTPTESTEETQMPTEPATQPTEPAQKPAGLNRDGTYTVREGDTLSEIAVRFGTTKGKLAAFNEIKNVDLIRAGMILKIPPKDYEIPQPTEPTEPATQPTEPETQPTEPETEPATQPTEQETEPTKPEAQPTEPETEPTESETEPVETEAQPTESVRQESDEASE